MAGLTPEDAEAAIELLEHEQADQADQAVRDREPAQRDQLPSPRAQLVAVAVVTGHGEISAALKHTGGYDNRYRRDLRF